MHLYSKIAYQVVSILVPVERVFGATVYEAGSLITFVGHMVNYCEDCLEIVIKRAC